jgi:hypothetical protein
MRIHTSVPSVRVMCVWTAGFFSGGTFRVKHDKALRRPAPSAYTTGHGETHIVLRCACEQKLNTARPVGSDQRAPLAGRGRGW